MVDDLKKSAKTLEAAAEEMICIRGCDTDSIDITITINPLKAPIIRVLQGLYPKKTEE